MTKLLTLEALFEESLKDLYSAEKQITLALPQMANAASSTKLKESLQVHLKETEGQIKRLEQISAKAGVKLAGKKCRAMEALIEEGKEHILAEGPEVLIDAAIVMSQQKIEHYEISSYGSVRTLAQELGLTDVAKLLEQTLREESATDEKLTDLCMNELFPQYENQADIIEESRPSQ
jgi:ferritin-like metal-binding protein YciE